MSFHEDSFHETKRERKKYENKKQKALETIKRFIYNVEHTDRFNATNIDYIVGSLNHIQRLVNDI